MIEIWHGPNQKVGHLGDAQPDFNVLGHVDKVDELAELSWSLNGREGGPLSFHTFRRLAQDGDFNADIPIRLMRMGDNTVTITASRKDGSRESATVNIRREEGDAPLPMTIHWANVTDPQDVGQYTDGRWILTRDGLRTAELGYDRVFLIGNKSWKDYEMLALLTLHRVTVETGPVSHGNGVGLIWRFAGHSVGGVGKFPEAQPKWGYLPFGAIGFLRWKNGSTQAPRMEYFPGDSNYALDYATFPVELEQTYSIRMRCVTLEPLPDGAGVTRYSYKIWPAGKDEPDHWAWERLQISQYALRQGGCALLAHHVDATFGDISITPVEERVRQALVG